MYMYMDTKLYDMLQLFTVMFITNIQNVEQKVAFVHVLCDTCVAWKPWEYLFTYFCVNLHVDTEKVKDSFCVCTVHVHITRLYQILHCWEHQKCRGCSGSCTRNQHDPWSAFCRWQCSKQKWTSLFQFAVNVLDSWHTSSNGIHRHRSEILHVQIIKLWVYTSTEHEKSLV